MTWCQVGREKVSWSLDERLRACVSLETSPVWKMHSSWMWLSVQAHHRSLASHIGIGSSSHCLFGIFLRIWDSSSTVTLLKLVSGGTCWCSIVGARAVTVVAWMVSNFPVKNALKSSAKWVMNVDTTGWSKEFILFQSDLVSGHLSMADDQ